MRPSAVIDGVDRFQQRHRPVAVGVAVLKKSSDDELGLLTVSLAWYGFTAIYPLLLAVVAIFGFLGAGGLGHGLIKTLHEFPVIGSEFNPGPGGVRLHGSVFGLVVGVAGLLYGAQGVTQTAQYAMAKIWHVPRGERRGFVARLLHSFEGLALIGATFALNAYLASFASAHGRTAIDATLIIAGLALVNMGSYLVTFRVLTAGEESVRDQLPGSIVGGLAFTALISGGAGLIQHQLRNSSATYGALSAVIGVVTFLLLLARITLYAAELNTVLAGRLWPRSLRSQEPA